MAANELASYFFVRKKEEMNNTTPDQAVAPYVAPYTAIGISTVVYTVSKRQQIRVNLQTIEDAIHAAMGVVSINLPVKLIALPEGALTGFPDEIFNIPHVTAARDIFIDIPGEETEYLGRLARHYIARGQRVGIEFLSPAPRFWGVEFQSESSSANIH